mgnify:CR=1 FL=1
MSQAKSDDPQNQSQIIANEMSEESPQSNQESEKPEISIGEILCRPAEEFVNDPNIEIAWMSTAIRHMEAYYKLITSIKTSDVIRLTPNDNYIYEEFRKQFPDLKVESLTEEMIKSNEGE